MNKENTLKLLKDFPDLYQDYYRSMKETCMCWGFDCGDGWFKLIYNLSKKLSKYCVIASQVKEKYGTLNYYYSINGTDKDGERVYKFVDKAERKSAKICEVCGKRGKLNDGGWLSVRCNKHRKEN